MISDADTFWRQILARVRPGRVSDSVSLAEAEQRMAAAGEDEIAPERVARIVRDVTGAAPAAARPQVVQGRVHRFPMARPALRWAVAATVALAPLAAVAFYKMYDVAPTHRDRASTSWDYPTAVRLLVDENMNDDDRLVAQARVCGLIKKFGIATLHSLRAEGGNLGAEAELVLAQWRAALAVEPAGVVESVGAIDRAAIEVCDSRISLEGRLETLGRLRDDVLSGIAALRAPVPEDEDMVRAQARAITNLAEALDE